MACSKDSKDYTSFAEMVDNVLTVHPPEFLNALLQRGYVELLAKVFWNLTSPIHEHFAKGTVKGPSPTVMLWFLQNIPSEQLFNLEGFAQKTVLDRKKKFAETVIRWHRSANSNYTFEHTQENLEKKQQWDLVKEHPITKDVIESLSQK